MLGSGFPGLVQLGVFAGSGLLVAAAVTRWALPALVARETRIVPRPMPRPMAVALRALRGRRRLALGLLAAALLSGGGGRATLAA